jgi:hypothetical protein
LSTSPSSANSPPSAPSPRLPPIRTRRPPLPRRQRASVPRWRWQPAAAVVHAPPFDNGGVCTLPAQPSLAVPVTKS